MNGKVLHSTQVACALLILSSISSPADVLRSCNLASVFSRSVALHVAYLPSPVPHRKPDSEQPAPFRTRRADSLPLLLRPAAHYWASLPDPTRTLAAIVSRLQVFKEKHQSIFFIFLK